MPTPAPASLARPGRTRALVLATFAFAANFWAWALLSPLAPKYKAMLHLSPLQVSIMVAVPVIVGSLGRIPLGALTDRLGGRVVFGVTTLVGVVPVLLLAFATSYAALLGGGLLLGLTGATFAIGVPYVNQWFPPGQRGFALGVFGMGNIGTAVSGFVSPALFSHFGRTTPYLVVAGVLAVTGVGFLLIGRDVPGRQVPTVPTMRRLRAALDLPETSRLAALYAVTFGGFVAFGVYLPTYLATVYGLSVAAAALRAAGFVVVATLARPAGGWLADRVGGVRVLLGSLSVVSVMAVVAAFEPSLVVVGTLAFLSLAAALGLGNGAVFAILGRTVAPERVGAVTGVVGAAGGLGGFLPPIVMGAVWSITGSYAIGLMLLSDVALAALVFTAVVVRRMVTAAVDPRTLAGAPAREPARV